MESKVESENDKVFGRFEVESNRPEEVMDAIKDEAKRLEELHEQDMINQVTREKLMQQVLIKEEEKKKIGNEDLSGILPDNISQQEILEHLKNREAMLVSLQQEVQEIEEDLKRFGPLKIAKLLSEMSPIRAMLLGNPETRRVIGQLIKIKKKRAAIKKLVKRIRTIRKKL